MRDAYVPGNTSSNANIPASKKDHPLTQTATTTLANATSIINQGNPVPQDLSDKYLNKAPQGIKGLSAKARGVDELLIDAPDESIRITLDRKTLKHQSLTHLTPSTTQQSYRTTGSRPPGPEDTLIFPDIPIPGHANQKVKKELTTHTILATIFQTPTEQKTSRHISIVDDHLKNLVGLTNYSKDFRSLLYTRGKYQVHPRHTVFISPSSLATHFYIILSGTIETFNLPQRPNSVLLAHAYNAKDIKKMIMQRGDKFSNILGPGDVFGEFTRIKDVERRSDIGVVWATSRVSVVAFTKADFLSVLVDLDTRFPEKQKFLNSLTGFRNLPKFTLDSISRLGAIRTYLPKQCIIKAGDPNPHKEIYFLMSGDATAYKLTTFIKVAAAGSSLFKPKYTLMPYDTEKQAVQNSDYKYAANQEIIQDLVPLGQIPIKGIFPLLINITEPVALRQELTNSVSNYTVIVGQASVSQGQGNGSYDYDGAVLGTPVEAFVIGLKELYDLVGNETVMEGLLLCQPAFAGFEDKNLQHVFLSSRQWNHR